jgi:integrase
MTVKFGPLYLRQSSKWYFNHYQDGKLVKQVYTRCLANKKEQAEKFREIYIAKQPGKPTQEITIASLAHLYLARHKQRVQERTNARTAKIVHDLVEHYGFLEAQNIKPYLLEDWLEKHPSWNPSTKALALSILAAMFSWACQKEKLAFHPMKGMKRPKMQVRGEEMVITDAIFQKYWQAAPGWLQDLMTFCWYTGCRPSEAIGLKAEEINLAEGIINKHHHKNSHKGLTRRILIPSIVRPLLERLLALHPRGYIFEVPGKRDIAVNNMNGYLARISKAKDLPIISTYSLRHSMASHAILKGIPDSIVAAWLGHHGTTMLHKHYAHTLEKIKDTAQHLDKLYASA